MKRVCVFCGSSPGFRPVYGEAARGFGQLLGQRGIGLVYGGGDVGLMGILADAAMAAGSEVVGVIPRALLEREVGHHGLTELRIVGSMHERKAMMAELSEGFIALPGGFGTFEEFCEVLTWTQLGLHEKACGLLNVEGFYDPLLALFDKAMSEGFLRPSNRELVLAGSDPAWLLDAVLKTRPHAEAKWIGRDES